MYLPLWCGSTSPSTITQDHSTVTYLVCKPGESPFHLTSHLVCSHSRITPQGLAQIAHHSCSPALTGSEHSETGCRAACCSWTRSRFTSLPSQRLHWQGEGSYGTSITLFARCRGRSSAAPDTSPTCSQFAATKALCGPCWVAGASPSPLCPPQVLHPCLVTAGAIPARLPHPRLFPDGNVRRCENNSISCLDSLRKGSATRHAMLIQPSGWQ